MTHCGENSLIAGELHMGPLQHAEKLFRRMLALCWFRIEKNLKSETGED